ncbi:MAG: S1 RNA-binding domain-containing protein, partial [Planctomycetota bacterium]
MNDQPKADPDKGGGLDQSLQREIEEALGGQSIEEIIDEAAPAPAPTRGPSRGPVQPGDIVPCRVVGIDRDAVLVEMGGKDQGMVALEQFEHDPTPGEVFQLEIVRYDRDEGLWVVSRAGAVERATWDDLAEGIIVEAFVDRSNKGGLEVSFGGVRAFMPVSQISMYRVEKPEEFVGRKLKCLVTEVSRRERRVIVSARALMEEEAEEKK